MRAVFAELTEHGFLNLQSLLDPLRQSIDATDVRARDPLFLCRPLLSKRDRRGLETFGRFGELQELLIVAAEREVELTAPDAHARVPRSVGELEREHRPLA